MPTATSNFVGATWAQIPACRLESLELSLRRSCLQWAFCGPFACAHGLRGLWDLGSPWTAPARRCLAMGTVCSLSLRSTAPGAGVVAPAAGAAFVSTSSRCEHLKPFFFSASPPGPWQSLSSWVHVPPYNCRAVRP